MKPEVWTTIEYAELCEPHRVSSLYIPVVEDDESRVLAAQLNIDPTGYNNGWTRYQPGVQSYLEVSVDAEIRTANPPVKRES